ncbi:MAG TPA: hypothetical protein VK186_11545, partial [Candidatus Deferrimicrobium sp.]|nr:hypothetical protein [Candidatus Deferrimicrobium sp.]
MTMNKNPDIQKKLIKDYWLTKLSRTAEYSSLPGPFPQAGAGNSTCSRSFLSSLSFPLPPAAVDPIKTISKNNPVTEFIINLAVWGILLYKYFNTPELWIVSPGLRENPEPDGGNTLLFFRLEISPGDSLKEILSNTRGEVLESFAHAVHNYGELKETLAGNFPGVDAFYRYGICDRRIHGESGEFENVDLRLALEMQIGEGLEPRLEIKYDQRRYQEVFVRQLAAHFVRLLGDTRDNLDKQVVDMEILSPVEKRHIIEDFNDIDTSSRPVKTIPGIF